LQAQQDYEMAKEAKADAMEKFGINKDVLGAVSKVNELKGEVDDFR
jgi:hypothetical protein